MKTTCPFKNKKQCLNSCRNFGLAKQIYLCEKHIQSLSTKS